MTFKHRVWDLLEARHDENRDGKRDLDWLDYTTICLILGNVVAIIVGTIPEVTRFQTFFYWFQMLSVYYFTAEYFGRIWSCTEQPGFSRPVAGRLRFMASFYGIVDLLAIAPFYLPYFVDTSPGLMKGLMLFRLMWLLKLGRYSVTASRIDDVVYGKRKELGVAFSLVGILVILAAAGVYFFEGEVQPDKFGSIPLAMWWSVVTLTTIGYGDVFPITLGGRIFSGFVALCGIGMIALPAGILASAFSQEFMKEEVDAAVSDVCPTCKRPRDPRE